MEKYYIPTIDEIHVGYECEEYNYHTEIKNETIIINKNKEWRNVILDEKSMGFYYLSYKNGYIRTRYLTKEDIKKEGWSYNNKFNSYSKQKNAESGYTIHFYKEKIVVSDTGECIFYGECKSINEFRKICKWLKIT